MNMATKSIRETNLNRAITRMEKALEVANELTWNAGGLNDISGANAMGVALLDEMGVIEIIATDDGQYFAIVSKKS